MKRLAAVATAVAVGASVIIATAGGQTPQARDLVLVELTKGVSFGLVDNPPRTKLNREGEPRRFSVGDMEVFSIPVADRQGNRVGRYDGQCVIVRPGTPKAHPEMCSAVYRLKDGLISVATTLVGEARRFTATITGGTGAYEGARGTLTSVARKGGGSTDTLHLIP